MENLNPFAMSRNDIDQLEISVRVGCPRMCAYCPQTTYVKAFKDLFETDARWLNIEVFRACLNNVDIDTTLRWTGFTEPLESADFAAMVGLAHDLGFRQLISTTLTGKPESIAYFVENTNLFQEGITLHMPDSAGLMKGKFLEEWRLSLSHTLKKLINSDIPWTMFLIGDAFHGAVSEVLASFSDTQIGDHIVKAGFLNSRASNVNSIDLGLPMVGRQESATNESHYCGYRRLNQGVLLPNGWVALCCQDYGLEFLLGDLRETRLKELYSTIETDPKLAERFISGDFAPCSNCEHYIPVGQAATGNRVT